MKNFYLRAKNRINSEW